MGSQTSVVKQIDMKINIIRSRAMTNEETVVRRVLEQWALKDPEALAQLFAEDGVYDNVPDEKPMEGHDAIRQWLSAVFQICRVEAEVLNMKKFSRKNKQNKILDKKKKIKKRNKKTLTKKVTQKCKKK